MRIAARAWKLACLALLACPLGASPARVQEAEQGDKHALLIGIKTYPKKGGLPPLQYTESGVEDLAKVLAKTGYRPANIRVMTQKAAARDASLKPTLANLRAAIKRWVATHKANDSLVLALAGHGVQFRGSKDQYFCPADADLKDPQRTLLSVAEVTELLQGSKARAKLLLVDACRNDPAFDTARGPGRGDWLLAGGWGIDPEVGASLGGSGKLPRVKLETERPDRPKEGSTVAMYGCSRGQKAFESKELGHTVFFHYVIKGMEGEADGNRDGRVTLTELYDFVYFHVPKFTRREFRVAQEPELYLGEGRLRGTVTLAMVKHNVQPAPDPRREVVPPPPRPPAVQPSLALTGHNDKVWAVALSPNGRIAASASGDKTIRLWDTATGRFLRTLYGHTGSVEAVAFSGDGSFVVSGGQDKVLRFWETANGKPVGQLSGHTGNIRSVALTEDVKWAATGGADRSVRLWNLKTFKQHWSYEGHTGPVYAVAISSNGWHILSGDHNGGLRYWATDKAKALWVRAHAKTVYGAAISPDGQRGLSGSADKTMRLWNLQTGVELRRFAHPDEVNGVAFSPDGRYAVSGCDDRKVRLWDLNTGNLLKVFSGHQALVYTVAYSRDGRSALSGSFDKTARVWDLTGSSAAPAPPVPAPLPEPPAVLVDHADLQVSVSWNAATDVDLHVIEPDGTKCFWNLKVTRNGGHLLKDVQDGTKGPEQYQVVKAARGTYKIKLHYYSGHLRGQKAPTRVTVVVRRFVGTPRAQTFRYTYNLTTKDQMVDVCSLTF